MDEIDRQILNIIQQNARITNADIARQVGLAPSAVLERVRKLEERGIIKGYLTKIDPRAFGLMMTAFVFVKTDDMSWESTAKLSAIPEVLEVHNVAGEDCYLLKVRVPNGESLSDLLHERIGEIEGVRTTRSIIVLKTAKEEITLPLDI
jgi:Lrp/AsnC family transcriptional regulator, leucine-responsive regulatory protein